jgi:PAS domain S-box-containing protein
MSDTRKAIKNRKRFHLFTIIIFVLLSIVVADVVVFILTRLDLPEVLSAKGADPSSLIRLQLIGFLIKTAFILVGIVILLLIARQNASIVKNLQKNREADQAGESTDLSGIMKELEEKDKDLGISQKQLSKALSLIAEKEKDLRIIFEKSPLGMVRVDNQGVIKEFNDKFTEILGSERDKLQDYPILHETVPELQKAILRAINGEKSIFENTYTSLTGTRTLYMRTILNPVNPSQTPIDVIASVEDITDKKAIEDQLLQSRSNLEHMVSKRTTELLNEIEERKLAQDQLKESEERYRLITENSSDVIWTMSLEGQFSYVSPSVKLLTGFSSEETLAMPIDKVLTPDSVERVMERLALELGRPESERKTYDSIEVQQHTREGGIVDIEVSVNWILGDDNNPVGIQGISRNITDRKRSEEALLKSEEKYRSILESIDDAYFETDLEGSLTFVNKAMVEMLGYTEEELLGEKFIKYEDEENYQIVARAFARVLKTGKKSGLINCTVFTKQKEIKHIGIIASAMKDKDGNITGIQGVARDVTEQRTLEQQLQQTQKMEAIGNLAGGVAHDFNNILSGILGYAQLIKIHPDSKSRVLSFVDHIIKASSRASGLIDQILLFSRKGESRKVPSDLGVITKEVLKLLRASIPSTIEIKHHFESDLTPVLADQTQIHQVLMNLSNNAAHAMGQGGGVLELKLGNIQITDQDLKDYSELSPGAHVKLSVSDTGHGMDPNTLDRIFEPYFTTKKKGEGTGLGLASVHGIVKDHEGLIQVESVAGRGTIFTVFFPVIEQEIGVMKKEKEISGGCESILFVDDEEYLSSIGKEMLEDFGYAVVSTTSSSEAYEMFQNEPDRFDLLITDFTMPEMTGDRLAERVLEIRPDLPVLMCTGIVLAPEVQQNKSIKKIIMKPLDMYDLLQAVREILDMKSGAEPAGSAEEGV